MSYSIGPPLVTCLAFSLRVKSGLIAAQCSPPSVVLNTTFPPRYTTLASVGDTAMGDVQLKRCFNSAGFISVTPERYGRMERFSPRSEEHTSELQSHSDLVCRLLLEKKK